jgi:hypothetical protein
MTSRQRPATSHRYDPSAEIAEVPVAGGDPAIAGDMIAATMPSLRVGHEMAEEVTVAPAASQTRDQRPEW